MSVSELLNGPLAGHLHGVVTIACLAAVAYYTRKSWTRPSAGRIFWGILSGFLFAFFLAPCVVHACLAGQPDFYICYAGLSVTALVITRGKRILSSVLPGALLLVFPALAFHYTHLVHEPGYVGNPAFLGMEQKLVLNQAREFAVSNGGTVPPGFLGDALESGTWKGAPDPASPLYGFFRNGRTFPKASPRWYTYFTGLWRTETPPFGLWTPGGDLSSIADKMELRERPPE